MYNHSQNILLVHWNYILNQKINKGKKEEFCILSSLYQTFLFECEQDIEWKNVIKQSEKFTRKDNEKKSYTCTKMWRAQLWKREKTNQRTKTNQQSSTIKPFNPAFIYESTLIVSPCCLPISRPLLLSRNQVLAQQTL